MGAKSCECCLMPLSKDPKPSGSDKHCSYCFVNGKLVADSMSLKEFQNKAYLGMRQHGHNLLTAWFFSAMIRFAPYWRARAT